MTVPFRVLWRGSAILSVVLLLSSSSVAESAEPLTLEAALSTARQNNPQASVARQRIEEARGELTGARVLLSDNPELEAGAGRRRPRPSGGEDSTDLEVGIEQEFELRGQRGHRIEMAQAEIGSAEAEAEDAQRFLDHAVARAFYFAVASKLRLEVLQENERLGSELYDVARRRLDAGEGTPLELNTSRIRLAEARRRSIAARTERLASMARLAELVGAETSAEFGLQGDLPGDEDPPPVDVLLEHAIRSRPDLVAAASDIEAADAAVELADAESWPGLGLGASYGREEDDDIISAGIRIPLPLFTRNQGERASTRAARERLGAVRDGLRRSIESEARQALLAYERARSSLKLYDGEVLRALEESLELLQRALDAGAVGLPEVILVHRELIEGQEGYLNARVELALARADLLSTVNLPQTGTLQGDAR